MGIYSDNFYSWMDKSFAAEKAAMDSATMEEHDRRFHQGHYDPKTQKCKIRQKLTNEDEISSARGQKIEAEEAMSSAASYLLGAGRGAELKRDKNAKPKLNADGKPFQGVDEDDDVSPRLYKDGLPYTGPKDGGLYFNGYGFKGIIGNRFWKGGVELAPTFQPEGTKSKYRMLRNKHIKQMIDKADGTFDLNTGATVDYPNGYQFAFQTTDSEVPGTATYLTDDEYDAKVEKIASETGSKPHLGNFDVPEVSFHVKDLNKAKRIAFSKECNQMGIWDWANSRVIENKDVDRSTNTVYA